MSTWTTTVSEKSQPASVLTHDDSSPISVPDALLTALGKQQSEALAPQISNLQNEVDLIISSAMKRTLQSTRLGWGPAIERLGIKNVICLPQAQGEEDGLGGANRRCLRLTIFPRMQCLPLRYW